MANFLQHGLMTHKSLSDEYDGELGDWIDEKMSICSSTLQDHGEYTNSSFAGK